MEKIEDKRTLNEREAGIVANVLVGNFENDPNIAIMLGNKIFKLLKKEEKNLD